MPTTPAAELSLPTLSINVPNFGSFLAGDDYGRFVRFCVAADQAGFDRIQVTDHVVMGSDTSGYTWSTFPTEPDAVWLEPLTMLALLAGKTERARLGTGIVMAALRGGAVLAKTAATLDLISGGRLDLGVGTGWQEREYEAAGLDFAKRGPLLDDTLAVLRALWSSAPAEVSTSSASFADVYCSPRPAPGRNIPIWVAGSLSKPVVRRVTTWGDGWIPIMGAGNDDLAAGTNLLRRSFEEAGRDPNSLQVRGRLGIERATDGSIDLERTMNGATALVTCGVTDFMVAAADIDKDADAAEEALTELVAAFLERFGVDRVIDAPA
ncbi:phthiodiolone/phenolphthiodiolone dimycocerosates ketoreductase [Rhodococcus sp. Br-6]|uniref:TIGR03619 family F420-dependent LLM class oxidoreductase n=1 Tax=Rhodococcus sp. OK519 TaxID=2135729 RepID=UPI0008581380|nr:putative F420-dependent oxidoreductase [Rhodococcus sp. OK519]GBF17652.1 phthiodiolone/phenolphthiodiolone dimycocerosates ketoreductase [Rhodococcus sp. Br-6]